MSVNFSLFLSRASPINHTPLSSRGITSIRICYRISSFMAIDFALEGLVFVMTAMMARKTRLDRPTLHNTTQKTWQEPTNSNQCGRQGSRFGVEIFPISTQNSTSRKILLSISFFPIISLTWLSVPVRVQCYFFVCFLR